MLCYDYHVLLRIHRTRAYARDVRNFGLPGVQDLPPILEASGGGSIRIRRSVDLELQVILSRAFLVQQKAPSAVPHGCEKLRTLQYDRVQWRSTPPCRVPRAQLLQSN